MNSTDWKINPYADVLDSRDVIARIEELREEVVVEGDLTNKAELEALVSLESEARSSPDWEYGEALIRYSHFEAYAQELADDCGMIAEGSTWPNNCIDWELAARELSNDYFQVDFPSSGYGPVSYWVRS